MCKVMQINAKSNVFQCKINVKKVMCFISIAGTKHDFSMCIQYCKQKIVRSLIAQELQSPAHFMYPIYVIEWKVFYALLRRSNFLKSQVI